MTPQDQSERLPAAIRTVATALTDVGRNRDHNEDCVTAHIPADPAILRSKGALYIVADGMGGYQAGEVASQQATEVIVREYYADPNGDIAESLSRAVRKANAAVYQSAQDNMQRKGMGTTAVAAVVRGTEVHIANVGDSRAYFMRGGALAQISKDHSFVQEQIDVGILTPEDARSHPQRNVITRALGHKPQVEVDTFRGDLAPGDVLLLCSDGLSGPVHDEEIAAVLQQYPPEVAAPRLVNLANELGGPDNISAIVVKVLRMGPDLPLAVVLPPKTARPAAETAGATTAASQPLGTPPEGVEPPPASSPPVAVPPEPDDRSPLSLGMIIGIVVLALALVVALVGVAVVLSRTGRGAQPTAEASATVTLTGESPDTTLSPDETGGAGATPAPGETPGDAEATATPELPATSTPRPTDTPRPLQRNTPDTSPGCAPQLPEALLLPADEASKYAGEENVMFSWLGGQLCDDLVWQVTIDGQETFCPTTTANEVRCSVPSEVREDHRWRVEIWRNGRPVPGQISEPRTLIIIPPPDNGPAPTDTPSPEPERPALDPTATKEGD